MMLGVILAAGRGTRLAPYTDAVNKEMLPVADIPIIEYNVRYLADSGVKKVLVVVSENKEQVIHYLRDGKRFGVNLAYVFQDVRNGAGTAKAVEVVKPWVDDSFIVVYGDSFFHPGDFVKRLLEFHRSSNAVATVGLHEAESPERFGVVLLGKNNRVVDVVEKPSAKQVRALMRKGKILANSGPLVFENKIFEYILRTKPAPNGEYQITDTIKLMGSDGLNVCGFKIPNSVFWRDIGTPEARLQADSYMLRKRLTASKDLRGVCP